MLVRNQDFKSIHATLGLIRTGEGRIRVGSQFAYTYVCVYTSFRTTGDGAVLEVKYTIRRDQVQ